MPRRIVAGFEAGVVEDDNGARVFGIKVRYARRGGIEEAQIRAAERAHENLDDQPHMTLTPSKAGRPWRGIDGQRPSLLDASEAFRKGFHHGARWARRDEQRRAKRRRVTGEGRTK